MKIFKMIIFTICLLPMVALAQMNIRVEDAYSREMPPGVSNIAVYLTIRNVGSHGVSLESVSTEVSESAMIHRSAMENGMMTMEHLPELYIAPRENARFEPGGLHIMLMGIKRPLRAGDSTRLNLSFSNGVVLRVDVPIVKN